jgi:hypothetical protein
MEKELAIDASELAAGYSKKSTVYLPMVVK